MERWIIDIRITPQSGLWRWVMSRGYEMTSGTCDTKEAAVSEAKKWASKAIDAITFEDAERSSEGE